MASRACMDKGWWQHFFLICLLFWILWTILHFFGVISSIGWGFWSCTGLVCFLSLSMHLLIVLKWQLYSCSAHHCVVTSSELDDWPCLLTVYTSLLPVHYLAVIQWDIILCGWYSSNYTFPLTVTAYLVIHLSSCFPLPMRRSSLWWCPINSFACQKLNFCCWPINSSWNSLIGLDLLNWETHLLRWPWASWRRGKGSFAPDF